MGRGQVGGGGGVNLVCSPTATVWCEVKLLSLVWFLSDLVVWGWGGLGWLDWWLGSREVMAG
ncbi:unnamed protein product [Prunus armeniaca]